MAASVFLWGKIYCVNAPLDAKVPRANSLPASYPVQLDELTAYVSDSSPDVFVFTISALEV